MNILFFVQLITEFLPISSSGHVELIKSFSISFDKDLHWSIDYIAHLPALFVSLVFFFSDFKRYFLNFNKKTFLKESFFIFISCVIPILFFLLKKNFNFIPFKIPYWYGLGITSYFLFKTKTYLNEEKLKKEEINLESSIFLGFAQSLAILFPGISRFGITLITALYLNFSPRYSIALTTLLGCIFQAGGGLLGLIYSYKYGLYEPIISNFSEILFLIISLLFSVSWYFVILNAYEKNTLWYLGYYELLIAIIGCLN